MTKKLWVMRNGEAIEISNMETSHIANTIAMIDRNAEKHLRPGVTVGDLFPVYRDLVAEMELRIADIAASKTAEDCDSAVRFALLELE